MRRRLEGAPELLDQPAHEPTELYDSLQHVAEVNRFLGGQRAVRLGVEALIRTAGRRPDGLDILDVGTGSADLPRSLVRHCRRRGIEVRVTATDLHPQILGIATAAVADWPEIVTASADALALPFDQGAFDIVLLSMALHHFDGPDQTRALREAARVARLGVVVSELERTRLNLLGARLLAGTRWRGNRLTRHDGPLSVRRAFLADELADLARRSDLPVVSLRRVYFQRLLLVTGAARR